MPRGVYKHKPNKGCVKKGQKIALKEKVGYHALHTRVRVVHGSPKKCEVCGLSDPERWYEWANLTGDLENPNDYKRMCVPCHRAYDKGREKYDNYKSKKQFLKEAKCHKND